MVVKSAVLPIRAALLVALFSLVAGWSLACEWLDKGELKPGLRPSPEAVVEYYRATNLRCPYFVQWYAGADGKRTGNECVGDVTLKLICKTARECRQIPPPHRTPRRR